MAGEAETMKRLSDVLLVVAAVAGKVVFLAAIQKPVVTLLTKDPLALLVLATEKKCKKLCTKLNI